MNYLHLLKTRFACKEFNKEKIPQAKINTILQSGVLSPSSLALEPWMFNVISDEKNLNKLKDFCTSKRQFETCSHAIIISSKNDFNPDNSVVQNALKRRDDYESIFQIYAPYLKRLQQRNPHEYGALQCYIAATNMINCAHTLGIDSCIIGGYEEDKINQVFLPKDEFCALVLVFGYRAKNQPKHPKIRYQFSQKVRFL